MATQGTGRADAVKWAMAAIRRADVLYLDTETTGLGDRDEIVDIAVLDNVGQVLLNKLVKPRRSIPADATAIHGISDRMVRDAPEWPEIYPDLVELLVSHKHVIVYNAEFDKRLIEQTCAIYGLRPPHPRWHCAMLRYAAFVGERNAQFGDYRWFKLEHAVTSFGLPVVATHRALSDTCACREVVWAMADAPGS